MNIEKVHEKAKSLMIKNRVRISRESGYSYYHGTRVANLAITLRNYLFPEIYEFDDIIYAAGYFHDIGKGFEPHNKYGAALAKEALRDLCTNEELDLICEIILNHCNKGGSNNDHFTSKLIQDADGIDWIGANGVWIDLYHKANIDMSSMEYIDTFKEPHDTGENAKFNYDITKQIFIDRMKYKNEFILRLSKEAIGEIYIPQRFGL
ncbi:MAG: hypothetical protein K0S47_2868 [Herbinix sp.]|jgi:HD superfamily phosphodiesterase|nr:hypothetical protein [Herbinix sp.]